MGEDFHRKEKEEELKTYKMIGLASPLKTRAQRQRIERAGKERVLRLPGLQRPPLRVSRQRYRTVRLQVTHELLQQAQKVYLDIPIESLYELLNDQIECRTYDVLAAELHQNAQVEKAFVQQHGRAFTREERSRFEEVSRHPHLAATTTSLPHPVSASFFQKKNKQSNHWEIEQLLASVQDRQEHNLTRYQTAWAQAVGPELAQQSEVQKVDRTRGIVYFRCLNSALSYQLQRQHSLPQKLSQLLKIKIEKVLASYF